MTIKVSLCTVPSQDHTFPGHPENPGRFSHFNSILEGELARTIKIVETSMDSEIALSSILTAHDAAYVQKIRSAMGQAPLFLDYGDTYATPQSYDSAIAAVAGTLSVLDAIKQKECGRGFALVRPPGHHTNQSQASGFCIFNNIAIAAKSLQNDGYAKVAIYDFDVHHGNGTQDIFYNDPNVLYISSHQWGIYPGTGNKHEVGGAEGEGLTLNIPLPAYSGDRAISQCYDELIQPCIARFQPDFILISAGFDAHWSDPLANLQFSTTGYHRLAKHLIQEAEQHCEGKIAFVLEGGYDPEALADNVSAVLYALANEDLPGDRLGPAPIDEPNIQPLIEGIRILHNL